MYKVGRLAKDCDDDGFVDFGCFFLSFSRHKQENPYE
jgi:hypothetical protein